MENNEFINFNLSTGTYSIDDFNAKIKVTILQKKQDWEPPQIKVLKLAIPEDYTFMTSITIFIALGIPDNYLEKTTLIRLTFRPGSHKTSLDITSSKIIVTALKTNQQKKTSWMVNHHVRWPACTFLIIRQLFSPMHLVFLELDTHRSHLDFKILDENNNDVMQRTFNDQLLNKEWAYMTMKQQAKSISRFKPYGATRTTNIALKKIDWNWDIFAWWNWSSSTDC